MNRVDQMEKAKCTGCEACFNICPTKAISMSADEEGFLYPEIDEKACINCGACIKKCPQIERISCADHFKEPIVYAAWNNDIEVREKSTSGGVFTALAEDILDRGGYVAAVRYNEKYEIEHCIISQKEEIPVVRQSKYAQSRKGEIYSQVKELLSNGKEVMFCGTPCECAALLKILNDRPDHLWIMDFICRGANSPKAYRCFLNYLEEKYGASISRVWFKNKTYGWNLFSTRVDFDDGSCYLQDRYHDLFIDGYIHHNLYMRPCCADCQYKIFPHISDITVADFWGVSLKNKDLDTDRGTSMVMINSEKGMHWFENIQEKLFSEKKTYEETLAGNPSILTSPIMSRKRDYFFAHLGKVPFDKLMDRCCRPGITVRLKHYMKKILKVR